MSSVVPGEPRAAKARQALGWCRYAHHRMRRNPTGEDWVLIWAGTIALLRAVGHALRKEDAAKDARLKKEQGCWWKALNRTKPAPAIFWDFIERDRNALLKEAELTVGQSLNVQGIRPPVTLGGDLRIEQQPQADQQLQPPRSIYYPARPGQDDPRAPPPIASYRMISGPFKGQDPRDLVRDAIEWWEKQLSDIEKKATAALP